jgi:hypothetical protein
MAISGSARTVTCGPAWLTASSLAAIVRMLPQAVPALLVTLTASQPVYRPRNLSALADRMVRAETPPT